MNIVIATSGHSPFDERIFYKIALSLKKYNHRVEIVCSTENIEKEVDGICVKGFDLSLSDKKEKIRKLSNIIASFNPSVIICCEPLTILAAYKFKKNNRKDLRIISDITEFYPYQSMLNLYSGIPRVFNYLRYFLFNLYATNLVDYLFIGEPGKVKLYRIIAPTKKGAIIGYYPPTEFFRYFPPKYDGKEFTLLSTGSISRQRGFPEFTRLIKNTAERFPDKIFIAKVVGEYEQPDLKNLLDELRSINNIRIQYTNRVEYKAYSDIFSDVDVCIDLRKKNKVFNHSLPIKVFDYMACGKPVIFSSLDSFQGFEDINKFGCLVDPNNLEEALERIKFYLIYPEKLKEHSIIARKLFEDKYNWGIIEKKMIQIIDSFF